MKFYKRDPNAAIAGMAELTLKQRGAYNSLIDLLYAGDGDLQDDDQRVARMMSCHWREWAAVKKELIQAGKVWVRGGKIRAKRVQETLKEASDFSQEQSKRASKGWQKRKNINENNDGVMPHGNAASDASTATATATATPKEDTSLRSVNGAKKATHRKHPLPDGWMPEPADNDIGYELGFIEKDIEQEHAKFTDWAISANALKSNWNAAFRNWLRTAAERKASRVKV